MRTSVNLAIDTVALAVYVIATNPATTGTPVHEWLSVGIAVVAFVHLVLHWDWAMRVARRIWGRLGSLSRVNFAVDAALLAAIVTVVMSGLMVSRSVLAPLGRTVTEASVWHPIHAQSSTVLLALVGLHLGLHWAWIASVLKHQALALARPRAEHRPVVRTVRRRSTHGTARAFSAMAVTVLIAGAIYAAAPASKGRLSWLALPGGNGVDRPDSVASASPTAGVGTKALGFEGTDSERIAVRTGHTLVVLGIAMFAGVASRELLRPG